MKIVNFIKRLKAICLTWGNSTRKVVPVQKIVVPEKASNSSVVGIDYNDLLKFKCASEQEFFIVGYTQSEKSRSGVGTLLVGYPKENKLFYAGKVGAGLNPETAEMLSAQLPLLHVAACPVTNYLETTNTRVHWVKPTIRVDLKFAEWTEAGRLKMPRLKAVHNQHIG